MAKLTIEQVAEALMNQILDNHPDDVETDHDGQLVIYTGIYRWDDGSFHNEQEPDIGQHDVGHDDHFQVDADGIELPDEFLAELKDILTPTKN